MLSVEDHSAHRQRGVRWSRGLALSVPCGTLQVAAGGPVDAIQIALVVCHPGVEVRDGGLRFRPAQQCVDRQLGAAAEQKLIGGESRGVVGGRVVGEEKLWEHAGPAALLIAGQSAEEIKQSAVKTFTLPVTLGVVGGSAGFGDTIQFTQLFDEVGFKTPPLI